MSNSAAEHSSEPGAQRGAEPEASTNFGRARRRAGVKQVVLADRTGISLRTIQRIEKGEIHSPGIRTLAALAREIGVDPKEICEPEWLRGVGP